MNKLFLYLLSLVFIVSCNSNTKNQNAEATEEETPQVEEVVEWITLFDGSSMDAWKGYMIDSLPPDWRVEDGVLIFEESGDFDKNQDIVTREEFENFELELEWKISEGGNSGIFYLVKETDKHPEAYYTGPEMQVLDNERHEDAKIFMHRAADLYDMKPCEPESVKPAGNWNQIKLIKNGNHVEHWMNGNKCVEYELWGDEWNEMFSKSKFAEWEDFARATSGKIALQDHGDLVMYRNIRIRRL